MEFHLQPKRSTENTPDSPTSLDINRDETDSDQEILLENGLRQAPLIEPIEPIFNRTNRNLSNLIDRSKFD